MNDAEKATWADFEKIDMRVGKIVSVSDFPEAKIPAYKLKVDLGPDIGVKASSARITEFYPKNALLGKKVVCVVNFGPKKIGPFVSEVLVMGAYSQGGVVLLAPDLEKAEPGDKIG